MVLGIAGLTMAAFSLFSGLGGLLGPFISTLFQGMLPPGQPDPFAGSERALWLNALSGLNFILLGGLLILGSAWLIMHNRRCVPVLRTWAVLKIGAELFSAYVGWLMAESQGRAAAQQSGIPLPLAGIFQWFGVIAVVIGAAVGMILPAFILVWFSLPKVRRVVAGWEPRARAAGRAAG